MTAPASSASAGSGAVAADRSVWLTRLTLLAILAAAALLVSWNIGREGLSNDYYAAAVRSMLDDPVAFLFAGFDSGRYITIDKPPLGYQLQAVSAADPQSRIRSAPASRSSIACDSASASGTAPWSSSPMWQCASTSPGTIQPSVAVSAPACGS